jgi:hypothetical protein
VQGAEPAAPPQTPAGQSTADLRAALRARLLMRREEERERRRQQEELEGSNEVADDESDLCFEQ